MFNIFKRFKHRRQQRRRLRELSAFARGFRTLDQLQQSGLLAWDQPSRRLYIDQSLALLMMKNVDTWTNFIQNTFLWQYSRECDRAWADYFQREELAAVRAYAEKLKVESGKLKDNSQLSRADIERIREARRQEILQSDMPAPKVDGFEFFIVAPPDLADGSVPSDSLTKDQSVALQSPVGELTAVGHYEPDTDQMQLALWSEVEPLIRHAAQ